MAFNKDQFKQNINGDKETNSGKINDFIEEFTDIVESEKFEDWLQKQLEYTSKHYHELTFYMGIEYKDNPTRFHFCISGDEYFIDDNIVYIEFGHRYLALDDYEKEYDEYIEAMDKCWKVLKQKLKSLDITITTSDPDWQIDYESYRKKIEVELIDED